VFSGGTVEKISTVPVAVIAAEPDDQPRAVTPDLRAE
jgi:hypothetical protein